MSMMKNCFNHSDREGLYTCRYCGRDLCIECAKIDVTRNDYSCEDQEGCLNYQEKPYSQNEPAHPQNVFIGQINEVEQKKDDHKYLSNDPRLTGGNVDIGSKEKHKITFGTYILPHNGIKPYVFVDSTEINIDQRMPSFNNKPVDVNGSFSGAVKTFRFEIGDFEKHIIEVKYVLLPIIGWFSKVGNRFIVISDGKNVYNENRISWWQYFFIYVPFIIFFGGVIPGMIGLSGVYINAKIALKPKLHNVIKISLLSVTMIIYIAMAMIYYYFQPNRK
jgi:hypothetical protein